MNALRRRIVFATGQPSGRPLFGIADLIILLCLLVGIYVGVRLAVASPRVLNGPEISLAPQALPYYALLSLGRMAAAYLLSIVFSLIYGFAAANNPAAERILLPILDVLQSVPILSFLPVVLLSLTAILPQGVALEIAAVILIFTSQAWNLTYSFYQSMKTLPTDLREASSIFRFNWWWRFRRMQLPFAAIGLLWNSVMSWAGGWFFLMAAETFVVNDRDFRLPGLGSYLQKAASDNNTTAILWGVGTLILVVVLLDQLVWQPLLAWANKFKVEMTEGDNPPTSWFLNFLNRSRLVASFYRRFLLNGLQRLDNRLGGAMKSGISLDDEDEDEDKRHSTPWLRRIIGGIILVIIAYGV